MTALPDRRLVPSPEALESPVGAETVLLHLADDTYYGLDAVGTRIWGMLREGATLPEVRDRLARDYAIPAATAEADLARFVEDLLARGLLRDA